MEFKLGCDGNLANPTAKGGSRKKVRLVLAGGADMESGGKVVNGNCLYFLSQMLESLEVEYEYFTANYIEGK